MEGSRSVEHGLIKRHIRKPTAAVWPCKKEQRLMQVQRICLYVTKHSSRHRGAWRRAKRALRRWSHKFQARQYRAFCSRVSTTQQVTSRGYEKETSMGKERRGEGKNRGEGGGKRRQKEEEQERKGRPDNRHRVEERLNIRNLERMATVLYV